MSELNKLKKTMQGLFGELCDLEICVLMKDIEDEKA